MQITALQHRPGPPQVAPERLAANQQMTEVEKLGEASRHFEAMLLRQILEASQKTVIKSSFSNESTSTSIYRDLVTSQLADAISRSGALGLARTFEAQLSQQAAAVNSASATLSSSDERNTEQFD